MSNLVTENWSGSQSNQILQAGQLTWQATVVWVVTGPTTELDALNAVVSLGAPHPRTTYLTCAARAAKQLSPTAAWEVTGTFNLNSNVPPSTITKLSQPAQLWNEPGNDTFPVTKDLDDNPYVNSGGDPFNPGLTEFSYEDWLTYRLWEPFYDKSKDFNYRNTVNSDTVTIKGIGIFDPGQVFCAGYSLVRPITSGDEVVQTQLKLGLRPGVDPWLKRQIDEGTHGWYGGTPERGPFCDKNGNFPNFPVYLDGSGVPISAKWYVWDGHAKQTPVANPDGDSPNIDLDLSTDEITILIFHNLESLPFSGLFSGL